MKSLVEFNVEIVKVVKLRRRSEIDHDYNCPKSDFKNEKCLCEHKNRIYWIEDKDHIFQPWTKGVFDYALKIEGLHYFSHEVNELLMMGEKISFDENSNPEEVKGRTQTGMRFKVSNLPELIPVQEKE